LRTDRNFSFLGGKPAASVVGLHTLLFKTAVVGFVPNEASSISSFDGVGGYIRKIFCCFGFVVGLGVVRKNSFGVRFTQ